MARARDVQADFAQLQREYRNMEQNRKAYTEESQNIIRRQQKSIDKLRKENESLKSELAIEISGLSVTTRAPPNLVAVLLENMIFSNSTRMVVRNIEMAPPEESAKLL